MANDLGVQFFTDAKAQFDSAGKWRWIILALLAYLHVGLVLPFAADTRDKAEVDRQLADSQVAEETLKSVRDRADKLARRVDQANEQVAQDLKNELVARFQRLNTVVSALAALGPAGAEGEDGAALFGNQRPQMMQQATAREDTSVLAPMSAELRRQIAESANAAAGELSPKLQAYIESELIAPAFTRANEEWRQSGLSIAQPEVGEITEGIAWLQSHVPTAAIDLNNFGGSIRALSNQAQRFTFAPPAGSAWWRTAGGKETSILSMTSDFAASVRDLNTSQVALEKLSTQIKDVDNKNLEAAKALSDALTALEKRAADLQSQLGEVSGPLKLISFKLSEIARFMPLIIAAALAALAAWTAEGLSRMTLAAGLVTDEVDSAVIHRWLYAAANGSPAQVARLAVTIASIAWVLAAAWNVRHLASPLLSIAIAVSAVTVLCAGRIYHWRRANQAAGAGKAASSLARDRALNP